MFYLKEPLTKNSPWVLSRSKDEKLISVPTGILRDLQSYHILGVDFLYQNYKKQFKGSILNEEKDMNMQLQVAAFLNAMLNYVEPKFLVLVISPDRRIVNWHYHLTVHGGLRVQTITPKTCPEDFDQEHGLALLLSFSNLKLSEYLIDYDYFSVVIDEFDEIASKLIIKKLQGLFNMGLTQRNFYIHPDQKLQWTMLNWSNPGCVGKLGDFYQVDNDNFANFRDNYRHWWFRLTWNFCESFKKPTDEEKREYLKLLSKWSASNHLKKFTTQPEKTGRKRKQVEIIGEDKSNSTYQKTKTNVNKKLQTGEDTLFEVKEEKPSLGEEKVEETEQLKESSSPNPQKVVAHETSEFEQERDPNYVELPSMDENPILSSIIRNLETSPEPILTQHSIYAYTPMKYDLEEPNCSKAFKEEEEEDILLSIIDDRISLTPSLDQETELNFKKEELRSQIFSDEPCTSKSLLREEDSEFFHSLIDPGTSSMVKKSGRMMKSSKSDDVEDILKETEILLK